MKKYIKEILKFLLGFILVFLTIFMIFTIHTNRIKQKNNEFVKSDQLTYKKNQNRIEFEYSKNDFSKIEKEVIKEPANVNNEYIIYYPQYVDKKLPLIIWSGNKGSSYKDYEKSLKGLSSLGFIVLSFSENSIGSGNATYKAIEFSKTLNDNKDSNLFKKIDIDNIGLAGHGEGACEVLNASYLKDNNSIKSIFLTSLPKLGSIENDFAFIDKSNLVYDMKKVSKPIFITAGSGKIDSFYSPLEALSENLNNVNPSVEAYGAIRKKYDNNLVNNYNSLGYMNAWFAYTLNKDTTAANAFIVNEEIKNNPKWACIKDNRKSMK